MTPSRSPKRRGTSTLATVITLIVVGLFWLAQQFLAAPAAATATPPAAVTPAATLSAITEVAESAATRPASWYALYFTDPDTTAKLKNPTGGVPEVVVASLGAAKRSLDIAMYDIDLPIYADALLAAQARGVRVRIVTDTDYRAEDPVKTLRAAKIPIVEDHRDPFMHNKFVVIDGRAVWTGSLNFTANDAYRNNNNFILIQSSRLAANYTAQFERMFTDQDFSPAVTPPNPAVNISGTLIENYFSPKGGVAAKILDVLNTAQSSVYFMAFSFTRTDFAQALAAKAKAGVTVQGVMEKRQIAAGGDAAWKIFQTAGLKVLEDGNPYVLHSKVFIVDQQIVVLGSYNFSSAAEDNNDENLLIIHNADIARAYLAEWKKVWAKANSQ